MIDVALVIECGKMNSRGSEVPHLGVPRAVDD